MIESGVVLLDKPEGMSSRRAVDEIRRIFKRIKAGHGGTLDPFATGMLPIFLGEATRFAHVGLEGEKSYLATLDLSLQTDTLDRDGKVIIRSSIRPSSDAVKLALTKFIGLQEQTPPTYSAIRIQGRRAYRLARAGEKVQLPTRMVHIHDLQIIDYQWPYLMLSVRCSKGTYIRALARDVGEMLGTGGCLIRLRRTSVAGWPEESMVSLEKVERQGWESVLTLREWLSNFPTCLLNWQEARRFTLGQRLRVLTPAVEGEVVVCCAPLGDEVIGLGLKEGRILQPKKVLPSAQKMLRECRGTSACQ